MPGKLRKSRSRNVTKSNNRPASRQSRKRKTPKGKGKARKTTRRRVKRGGMFGRKKDHQQSTHKEPTDEKEALEQFLLHVIYHFLITKYDADPQTLGRGLTEANLEKIQYKNKQDQIKLITKGIINTTVSPGEDPSEHINVQKAMPGLDIRETILYHFKTEDNSSCITLFNNLYASAKGVYDFYKDEEISYGDSMNSLIKQLTKLVEDKEMLNLTNLNDLVKQHLKSGDLFLYKAEPKKLLCGIK